MSLARPLAALHRRSGCLMCYDCTFGSHWGERALAEHISRKELKQDKIHDAIEHSAEAVYSHKQVTLIVVLVVLLVLAAGYGGWSIYTDRQTAAASAAFDTGMKAYSGRVGPLGGTCRARRGESTPTKGRARTMPAEIYRRGRQISEHKSGPASALLRGAVPAKIWTGRTRRWNN